jgi:hypothetical protein
MQPIPDRQLRLPNGIVARNQPCKPAKNVAPQFANNAPKIYKVDVRGRVAIISYIVYRRCHAA